MPSRPRHRGPQPSTVAASPAESGPSIYGLTESRRRAIYVTLAEARAVGLKRDAALYAVAKKFVVTVMRVEAVEREGLAKGWPTEDSAD